jgi:small subunit ribosomal protein S8
MNSDPISDFLTRIRNASMVNKPTVSVPHSKFKYELSKLLKTEGYISDVKVNSESSKKELQIDLKYSENGSPVLAGLNRLSTPGRRLYVGSDELPRNNGGLGTVIVSTSRGLLSDSEARKRKLGGELICEVWS